MNDSELDDLLNGILNTIVKSYEDANNTVLNEEHKRLVAYGINNGLLLALFIKEEGLPFESMRISMGLN